MKEKPPTHILVSATTANRRIGRLLDQVSKTQNVVVVTRHGKPKAVLLGVDNYNNLISGTGLPPVEVKGWSSEDLEAIRGRTWKDLETQID